MAISPASWREKELPRTAINLLAAPGPSRPQPILRSWNRTFGTTLWRRTRALLFRRQNRTLSMNARPIAEHGRRPLLPEPPPVRALTRRLSLACGLRRPSRCFRRTGRCPASLRQAQQWRGLIGVTLCGRPVVTRFPGARFHNCEPVVADKELVGRKR